jgi:hypothetical protein
MYNEDRFHVQTNDKGHEDLQYNVGFVVVVVADVDGVAQPKEQRGQYLKINNIEKSVSSDPTRPCIHTYNKNLKIYPRINSTVNVIRTCIFRMLSVLEGTQRVPPTCTRKTSRT